MRYFIVIVAVILSSSVCYADISGVSGDTITGGSFGSHADYSEGDYTGGLNAKWKDFEDGSLTSGGWVEWGGNSWVVESTGNKENSSYFGKRIFDSEFQETAPLYYYPANATGIYYVSFWFYRQGTVTGGKFWRLYIGGVDNDDNIYFVSHSSSTSTFGELQGENDETNSLYETPTIGADAWHFYECLIDGTGNGGYESGSIRQWIDGVEDAECTDLLYTPFSNMNSGSNSFRIGDRVSPAGTYYGYDDIYVSYTQARVMVGNNATFANCTHREIQIPTAWSDTEITVTWNQGAFENNATAYLFVIDADGVASAGLEGTFVDGTFYSDGAPPPSGSTITWGSGSTDITITFEAGAEDITIQ